MFRCLLRRIAATLVFAAAIPNLAACASTSPKPAFKEVSALVEQRTGGRRLYWNNGTLEDTEVAKAIARMLEHEMSEDVAVQIALLNNRKLLGTYEELGIAQADVVQAGLLRNPTFGASVRLGDRQGPLPTETLGVTQDFLSVLTLAARKKIANRRLEATKLRVADAVLETARNTKVAYVHAQAAEQMVAMRRTILEAAEASIELARGQHEAGNLNDFELATQEGQYEAVRLELTRAETEAIEAREELNRELGLWGKQLGWRIRGRVAEIPTSEPPLESLETLAIDQRLDLAAAKLESSALEKSLAMTRGFRWLGGLDVGLTADRHGGEGGGWDFEPNASIELPIFDQRQAVIARLEAEVRQSHFRIRAIAVDIRSEVRALRARLTLSRGVLERYQKVLVPLQERIVTLAQEQYNAMLLGVFQLLQAKQAEINAYSAFIDAARSYWVARADLERAVGGRLPPPQGHPPAPSAPSGSPAPQKPSSPQQPQSPSSHEHHHGAS
ncbi:TolC family protein [Pendulispora albinea]|uniref:TolC family protein n=1 Tax=Pendulispora albinea TaxID=2741071 RepID=A0ABZ2MCA5_9BACT